MIGLVALSVCLISCVSGGPVLYGGPVPVGAPAFIPLPLPLLHTIRSQFHTQNDLGQYSYGYSNEHSSKVEAKDFNGLTSGGYSYIDANGLVQNVNYVSDDENGFRVAASNLPVVHGVHVTHDTPVFHHPFAVPQIPQPVTDTPEVQQARKEHEKVKAEIEQAAANASSEESSEESTEDSSESTESSEEDTKPVNQGAPSVATSESPVPKSNDQSIFLIDERIPNLQSLHTPKPIFRAAMPYYQGAFVAPYKRETPASITGFLVRNQNGVERYTPDRRDVDGNVLREQ